MASLLTHTRRHDITFNRNGCIRIASRIVRMLSISPGDSININLHNGEYLLYVTRHTDSSCRYEAQCYPSKGNNRNYCANSVRLCRALFASVGYDGVKRVSYAVGEPIKSDAKTYVPIITRQPLS